MSNDRNNKNGQFVKGNKAAHSDFKAIKLKTRTELFNAVQSLCKPMSTLQDEMDHPDQTRWEFIIGSAIQKHNTKFIQWLFEMAIGRPTQLMEFTEESELLNNKNITINFVKPHDLKKPKAK